MRTIFIVVFSILTSCYAARPNILAVYIESNNKVEVVDIDSASKAVNLNGKLLGRLAILLADNTTDTITFDVKKNALHWNEEIKRSKDGFFYINFQGITTPYGNLDRKCKIAGTVFTFSTTN